MDPFEPFPIRFHYLCLLALAVLIQIEPNISGTVFWRTSPTRLTTNWKQSPETTTLSEMESIQWTAAHTHLSVLLHCWCIASDRHKALEIKTEKSNEKLKKAPHNGQTTKISIMTAFVFFFLECTEISFPCFVWCLIFSFCCVGCMVAWIWDGWFYECGFEFEIFMWLKKKRRRQICYMYDKYTMYKVKKLCVR